MKKKTEPPKQEAADARPDETSTDLQSSNKEDEPLVAVSWFSRHYNKTPFSIRREKVRVRETKELFDAYVDAERSIRKLKRTPGQINREEEDEDWEHEEKRRVHEAAQRAEEEKIQAHEIRMQELAHKKERVDDEHRREQEELKTDIAMLKSAQHAAEQHPEDLEDPAVREILAEVRRAMDIDQHVRPTIEDILTQLDEDVANAKRDAEVVKLLKEKIKGIYRLGVFKK